MQASDIELAARNDGADLSSLCHAFRILRRAMRAALQGSGGILARLFAPKLARGIRDVDSALAEYITRHCQGPLDPHDPRAL